MGASRTRRPSNAVTKGGPVGTAVGAAIEIGAAAAGVPLPPGSGAALGGVLATLFAYFFKGGRRGEAD